jgi:diguanylate cyclase (GGDEF)-like protein
MGLLHRQSGTEKRVRRLISAHERVPLHHLPAHSYLLRRDGVIAEASHVALTDLGVPYEQLVGRPFHPMLASGDGEAIGEWLSKTLTEDLAQKDLEITLGRSDGRPLVLLIGGTRLADRLGRVRGLLLVGQDVSQLRETADQNGYLAFHDPLTGLHNRRSLDDILRREEARCRRYGHSIAFMMVDVDHFKAINDTYGHLTGDQVLRYIARILGRATRSTDIAVRYGGDEFLVVMPETDGEVDAVIQRVDSELARAPWQGMHLSVSAGCAHWSPGDPRPLQDVILQADQRMYCARAASREGLHS